MRVEVPGRVNLIGDHTDYTGGLVFPMAIDRWTTIDYTPSPSQQTTFASADETEMVSFDINADFNSQMTPQWGRYVAAVTSLMAQPLPVQGEISTTIPIGSGLSSSAALEIAIALASGFTGTALELAQLTQHAEHLATGVPTGIMDQLCIASARAGHASIIDCTSHEITHVPIPEDIEIVVQLIAHRTLQGSEYSDRVAECANAEKIIGPLRLATLSDIAAIKDTLIAGRAAHVITENQRVTDFADALSHQDFARAGEIMTSGHNSLAHLFGTSTDEMNTAVAHACATPGVFGARMTGGGFGGCIVALCEPGTILEGWRVQPVGAPNSN